MKVNILKQFDAAFIDVEVAVRYEEEDIPKDAPKRSGDMWRAIIDLNERKVLDWPQGEVLSFDMKICDEGIYTLLDENMEEITRYEGYVPNQLLPGSFGDCLALDIDGDGIITNWRKDANLSNFEE